MARQLSIGIGVMWTMALTLGCTEEGLGFEDFDTDSQRQTDENTTSDTDDIDTIAETISGTDSETVSSSDVTGDECTSNDQCRQTLYPHLSDEYGTLLDCELYQGDRLCLCDSTPCRDLDSETCDDGLRNQGETGIDCGGPCSGCGTDPGWRWAHSGDGNQHDPDDWHASAMSLALMHQAGLKHKLVHFNWNNHLGDNSSSMKNQHDWHVNTARQTFEYTNDSIFHNCQDDLNGTVTHLKEAINASSADNLLILTCAGPMEVCWRALNEADDDKEQYVVVLSHSSWNDNHDDTSEMNHTWNDIVNDFEVLAHHINDQNPPAFKSDCTDWNWTKSIPGYGPTLYDLLCQEAAAGDASDAGMVYYMIQQNGVFHGTNGTSNPTMGDVQDFF